MEVEIKIKIEDKNAVIQKILVGGGKKIGEGIKHDVYYDDGKGFYSNGNVLRIRTGSDKPELTAKQHPLEENQHIVSRPEFQTHFEDPVQMDFILQAIGFLPYVIKEKKYENYEFDGVVVEFHTLPHLGEFVEIEGSKSKIQEVLPKIGLSEEMGLSKSYNQLFEEYRKEHNLPQGTQDTFDHV